MLYESQMFKNCNLWFDSNFETFEEVFLLTVSSAASTGRASGDASFIRLGQRYFTDEHYGPDTISIILHFQVEKIIIKS